MFAEFMSKLKTHILALFCVILPPLAHATTVMNEDPLRLFATCAGRLSAQMEHQWLMTGEQPWVDQKDRDQMEDLIWTLSSDGNASDILSWRLNAKRAHAQLLTRATYSTDASDSEWALSRAREQVDSCLGLMLN